MVQSKVILRQNYALSHELDSERSERASKQMSAEECGNSAKQTVRNKRMSERCERPSEPTSE